jgi:hypothetical protein
MKHFGSHPYAEFRNESLAYFCTVVPNISQPHAHFGCRNRFPGLMGITKKHVRLYHEDVSLLVEFCCMSVPGIYSSKE